MRKQGVNNINKNNLKKNEIYRVIMDTNEIEPMK